MATQTSANQKPVLVGPFADFDRYFGRMMRSWPFTWPDLPSAEPRALRPFEHVPNVEVRENDRSYSVTVELPGLDEKDIKVTVENETLTIAGEKKLERSDEKTHFSERSYGSFTRSFSLPDDADRSSISARFAKGVLMLEIAKSAVVSPQGKQIEVKSV
jgi:HSP20 family protein